MNKGNVFVLELLVGVMMLAGNAFAYSSDIQINKAYYANDTAAWTFTSLNPGEIFTDAALSITASNVLTGAMPFGNLKANLAAISNSNADSVMLSALKNGTATFSSSSLDQGALDLAALNAAIGKSDGSLTLLFSQFAGSETIGYVQLTGTVAGPSPVSAPNPIMLFGIGTAGLAFARRFKWRRAYCTLPA